MKPVGPSEGYGRSAELIRETRRGLQSRSQCATLKIKRIKLIHLIAGGVHERHQTGLVPGAVAGSVGLGALK